MRKRRAQESSRTPPHPKSSANPTFKRVPIKATPDARLKTKQIHVEHGSRDTAATRGSPSAKLFGKVHSAVDRHRKAQVASGIEGIERTFALRRCFRIWKRNEVEHRIAAALVAQNQKPMAPWRDRTGFVHRLFMPTRANALKRAIAVCAMWLRFMNRMKIRRFQKAARQLRRWRNGLIDSVELFGVDDEMNRKIWQALVRGVLIRSRRKELQRASEDSVKLQEKRQRKRMMVIMVERWRGNVELARKARSVSESVFSSAVDAVERSVMSGAAMVIQRVFRAHERRRYEKYVRQTVDNSVEELRSDFPDRLSGRIPLFDISQVLQSRPVASLAVWNRCRGLGPPKVDGDWRNEFVHCAKTDSVPSIARKMEPLRRAGHNVIPKSLSETDASALSTEAENWCNLPLVEVVGLPVIQFSGEMARPEPVITGDFVQSLVSDNEFQSTVGREFPLEKMVAWRATKLKAEDAPKRMCDADVDAVTEAAKGMCSPEYSDIVVMPRIGFSHKEPSTESDERLEACSECIRDLVGVGGLAANVTSNHSLSRISSWEPRRCVASFCLNEQDLQSVKDAADDICAVQHSDVVNIPKVDLHPCELGTVADDEAILCDITPGFVGDFGPAVRQSLSCLKMDLWSKRCVPKNVEMAESDSWCLEFGDTFGSLAHVNLDGILHFTEIPVKIVRKARSSSTADPSPQDVPSENVKGDVDDGQLAAEQEILVDVNSHKMAEQAVMEPSEQTNLEGETGTQELDLPEFHHSDNELEASESAVPVGNMTMDTHEEVTTSNTGDLVSCNDSIIASEKLVGQASLMPQDSDVAGCHPVNMYPAAGTDESTPNKSEVMENQAFENLIEVVPERDSVTTLETLEREDEVKVDENSQEPSTLTDPHSELLHLDMPTPERPIDDLLFRSHEGEAVDDLLSFTTTPVSVEPPRGPEMLEWPYLDITSPSKEFGESVHNQFADDLRSALDSCGNAAAISTAVLESQPQGKDHDSDVWTDLEPHLHADTACNNNAPACEPVEKSTEPHPDLSDFLAVPSIAAAEDSQNDLVQLSDATNIHTETSQAQIGEGPDLLDLVVSNQAPNEQSQPDIFDLIDVLGSQAGDDSHTAMEYIQERGVDITLAEFEPPAEPNLVPIEIQGRDSILDRLCHEPNASVEETRIMGMDLTADISPAAVIQSEAINEPEQSAKGEMSSGVLERDSNQLPDEGALLLDLSVPAQVSPRISMEPILDLSSSENNAAPVNIEDVRPNLHIDLSSLSQVPLEPERGDTVPNDEAEKLGDFVGFDDFVKGNEPVDDLLHFNQNGSIPLNSPRRDAPPEKISDQQTATDTLLDFDSLIITAQPQQHENKLSGGNLSTEPIGDLLDLKHTDVSSQELSSPNTGKLDALALLDPFLTTTSATEVKAGHNKAEIPRLELPIIGPQEPETPARIGSDAPISLDPTHMTPPSPPTSTSPVLEDSDQPQPVVPPELSDSQQSTIDTDSDQDVTDSGSSAPRTDLTNLTDKQRLVTIFGVPSHPNDLAPGYTDRADLERLCHIFTPGARLIENVEELLLPSLADAMTTHCSFAESINDLINVRLDCCPNVPSVSEAESLDDSGIARLARDMLKQEKALDSVVSSSKQVASLRRYEEKLLCTIRKPRRPSVISRLAQADSLADSLTHSFDPIFKPRDAISDACSHSVQLPLDNFQLSVIASQEEPICDLPNVNLDVRPCLYALERLRKL